MATRALYTAPRRRPHSAPGMRAPLTALLGSPLTRNKILGWPPRRCPPLKDGPLRAHHPRPCAASCVHRTALSGKVYMQQPRSQTPRPLSRKYGQKVSHAAQPNRAQDPCPALALRAGQELVVLAVGRSGLRGHGLEVVHHRRVQRRMRHLGQRWVGIRRDDRVQLAGSHAVHQRTRHLPHPTRRRCELPSRPTA